MDVQYLEHKFKDMPPEKTIEKIQSIMKDLGIDLDHYIRDADTGECFSAHVSVADTPPLFSNGKGICANLALASAYAEFIERLQCGLFFYKFQSFNRFKDLDLQTYAPDRKYMTLQELEETGDWMDYLIESYGHGLTRKRITQFCKIFACADDDKILTIPYYSLFEDKYVYLPAAFVEHIYASNGCCAGNTREEAWVHAFSEIMERHCMIQGMLNEKALPKVTEQAIARVPLAKRIIAKIRETGMYDIDLFDLSNGGDIPVICTRIINKSIQSYVFNAAADPIFEIAVSRGLTEIMQGRSLDRIAPLHDGNILTSMNDFTLTHNVLNQLETGNGVFAAGLFTEELSQNAPAKVFADHTSKTNTELLQYVMDVYRKIGKPVYIRNYSFLGFPSYHFVIPGFSEFKWVYLLEQIPEYAFGDEVLGTLRNPCAASDAELALLLSYYKKVRGRFSACSNFNHLTGLPFADNGPAQVWITLAYASHRTGSNESAINYLSKISKHSEYSPYFRCVTQYLKLLDKGLSAEQIRSILYKFNSKELADELYESLARGESVFDHYLLHCTPSDCSQCNYSDLCRFTNLKRYMPMVGERYSKFTAGQDRSEFAIEE